MGHLGQLFEGLEGLYTLRIPFKQRLGVTLGIFEELI
jgi:hypothetical protein